ncbi:MAG: N-acetylmuramate/N-acetylglucosamine kinase AmgK [Phenylobacterium sp.]
MTAEREGLKDAFLRAAGLGGARRERLAGDASTRAYERLFLADGSRRIFMDQPPVETAACPPEADAETRRALGYNALARLAAGRVDAFVAVAGWLGREGLSAPRIDAFDAARGLAVMEDLGDDLFGALIAGGADETPLYEAAIDALVHMQSRPVPGRLGAEAGLDWPVLTYDALALQTAADLLPDWLPALRPQVRVDAGARADWSAIWAPILQRGEDGASVFCHRDYHVENLIWLPGREGPARVGMVDFQDAVLAHPAWDLSMLLHDARRDVSRPLSDAMLECYLDLARPLGGPAFVADFHALGALNICRIIGVFARLVVRDGRPRYEAFLPRMWGYLDACLADPGLAGLRAWLDACVPMEARR